MQRRPTQSVKVKTNENIPQGPRHNNKAEGEEDSTQTNQIDGSNKRQSKSTKDAAATGRRAQLPKPTSQHSHTEHKKE